MPCKILKTLEDINNFSIHKDNNMHNNMVIEAIVVNLIDKITITTKIKLYILKKNKMHINLVLNLLLKIKINNQTYNKVNKVLTKLVTNLFHLPKQINNLPKQINKMPNKTFLFNN